MLLKIIFYYYFCIFYISYVYGSPPYREKISRSAGGTPTILPHCSYNSIMEGQIETASSSSSDANESDANGERTNVTGSIMFHMSLNETACIKLETNGSLPGYVGTSSILHSIEFLRLEHHYSITGKYLFGIPSISFDCKCDCAGGDPICTFEEYYHKNCSSSSPLCYASFLPFQSNTGCFSSQPSAVCCKMSIRPHENWMFEAITISQPSTVLVLRYRIFEKLNRGWKKSVDEKINVSLNSGGAKYDLNREHSIELIASGSRPHRQLEPGNYFWQIGPGINEKPQLRGKIAINDFNETSLEKLGWFRMESNTWTIKNGLGRMPKAQHIQVKDCKAQSYLTTLDAEQFVLEGADDKILSYNLGSAIIEDPWVGGIEIGNRAVTVNHAEGTSLLLTLKAKTQPRAVHHISQFSTFNGSIQLDKDSNRFLNLTFLDTRGTLIGQIFNSETRSQMDIVFSIQTSENIEPEFKAIVSLPSSIDSRRYVCIHASGDLDSQQCQWLEYKADPLNANRIAHRWQQAHSDCNGCNERGMDLFLTNLDPRRWFDGLNSPAEIMMCVFEILLGIVLFMATIALCTKCFIPLTRWLICIPKVPKK